MQKVEVERKEAIERIWFRRVVTVLMVGMIAVGALPLLKSALFPVERVR